MSRTYQILLAAVVAVIAVGGYWKLALAPKRAEAADLSNRVAVAQAQIAQQESLIKTYEGAKDAYKVNYDTVTRLGKAVPNDDDTRSLLVQLDTSAKRSGVAFDTLNINAGGTSSDPASTSADSSTIPGTISAGSFSSMPISLNFAGTFDTLGNFFSRLERFVTLKGDSIEVSGRLVRVENITLAPSEDGWPALSATIGAAAYVVPDAGTDSAAAAGAQTSTSTTTTTTTAQAAGPNNDQ